MTTEERRILREYLETIHITLATELKSKYYKYHLAKTTYIAEMLFNENKELKKKLKNYEEKELQNTK